MKQLKRQQVRLQLKIGRRSREIYTDPDHPVSFSHPERVWKALRAERKGMEHATLHSVKRALSALPVYSKHREIQRKFPAMTTRADNADERWQIDLMNVLSFDPDQNDGFTYLLMIIDVFSRRLNVVPIYDRSSTEVAAAIELVFMTTGRIPHTITSDSGQEFKGKAFRSLCRKYNIVQYFTVSDKTHASVVERVIRTIRTIIGRYITHFNSKRFIDHLDAIVHNYNSSKHSTLGMTPQEAGSSIEKRQLALFNLKKRLNHTRKSERRRRRMSPLPFGEGDETRIPVPFRRFRKSHEPSFSDQTFTVTKAFRSDKFRPVARLQQREDGAQGPGKPVFYPHELSIVTR